MKIGDGYAFVRFVNIVQYLSGQNPSAEPTYEKFLLPEPFVKPRASYTDALKKNIVAGGRL